jgi:DNA-binding XRE family transcriptional regulator
MGPGLGRPLVDTIHGSSIANLKDADMSGHTRWKDIRAEHVARAGGEDAVAAGKPELLNEVIGHRLAQIRRARGLTQQDVAERMGVTKGRVSQIEQGSIAGHDVLARFAAALGGQLHQAIYFEDGDIAAIA